MVGKKKVKNMIYQEQQDRIKKVEALKINLKNAPSGVYVRYKAYVENNGWQSWKTANAEAGSTGKNLKLLGLRIELQGTTEYSVYYRTHIQDRGWTDWKRIVQ